MQRIACCIADDDHFRHHHRPVGGISNLPFFSFACLHCSWTNDCYSPDDVITIPHYTGAEVISHSDRQVGQMAGLLRAFVVVIAALAYSVIRWFFSSCSSSLLFPHLAYIGAADFGPGPHDSTLSSTTAFPSSWKLVTGRRYGTVALPGAA